MHQLEKANMPIDVSMSDEFYLKLAKAVEENLENESFGVEELAQEVGYSRSHIHRKLQALTGQSVSQFIREIRLTRAHELLQDKVGTASEIAHKVGFSSPSYFNKCYHEFFGYPPGETALRNAVSKTQSSPLVAKGPARLTTNHIVQKRRITIAALAAILVFTYFFYQAISNKQLSASDTQKSIAVLPFKTIGGDPEGQYFADGIQDELLNHLSTIDQLKVKSRTSVERFRDTTPSKNELISDLGLTHFVEGTARKLGDRIRITVKLVDAKTDNNIWTEDYDREYTNIWETQVNIAQSVANRLQINIAPETLLAIERQPTQSPTAWDLYLRSQYHWRLGMKTGDPKEHQERIKYLYLAIEEDPDFALAYAKLAETYNAGILGRGTVSNDSALILANIAIEKDSLLPEPYLVRAQHNAYGTGKRDLAIRDLTKALSIAPNNPLCLFEYAKYQYYVNWDHESAFKYTFKAIDQDPDRYLLANMLGDIGHWYTELMDYDMALAYCETAKNMYPDDMSMASAYNHLINVTGNAPIDSIFDEDEKQEIKSTQKMFVNESLAMRFFEVGEYDSCIYYFTKAGNIWGWDERVAISLIRLGRKQEANAVLQQEINHFANLRKINGLTHREPEVSRAYALMGKQDSAYFWLRKALDKDIRWGMLWHLEQIPHYDAYREDPEYQQIIADAQRKIATRRAEIKSLEELGEIPASVDELDIPGL